MKIPDRLELKYSAEEIKDVVETLGRDITTWANHISKSQEQDIIAVPVLRGGIFFFSDLVRKIECSVEIAPVRTWGYVAGKNDLMRDELEVSLQGLSASGRVLLLIDDICDSGRTLASLAKRLLEEGATEVRTAALIKREVGEGSFEPNYVGFRYSGEEWFCGYGMQDKGRYRNLPSVYTIKG